MSEENVEIVRRWVRATNAGNFDDAAEIVTPDFEMTESAKLPGAAKVSGLDEARTYWLGWKRNWSEWDWREEEITELSPDKVLLIATLWLRGLRSGIPVERRWAYIFEIRDGKLARQAGDEDREQALEAARLSE
jgi:ketosteroid isomerase-like protein